MRKLDKVIFNFLVREKKIESVDSSIYNCIFKNIQFTIKNYELKALFLMYLSVVLCISVFNL